MRGIRSRDTKPELAVRRYLHSRGLRFRVHGARLAGRPDVVLTRHRVVVFVHGCFWHRHPGCRLAYEPKSRIEFWSAKLRGNAIRDSRDQAQLRSLGWRVLVIWECEIDDARLAELADTISSIE